MDMYRATSTSCVPVTWYVYSRQLRISASWEWQWSHRSQVPVTWDLSDGLFEPKSIIHIWYTQRIFPNHQREGVAMTASWCWYYIICILLSYIRALWLPLCVSAVTDICNVPISGKWWFLVKLTQVGHSICQHCYSPTIYEVFNVGLFLFSVPYECSGCLSYMEQRRRLSMYASSNCC